MNLDNLNSDQLSVKLDEIEKDINKNRERLDTLSIRKNRLEIFALKLNESIRKCKQLIRLGNSDKEVCERAYWRSRGK